MSNANNEWPAMAETEYKDGVAVPGTSPTTIVSVGGSGSNNKPFTITRSAACAFCDRWAVNFYIGQDVQAEGDLFNVVVRRVESTLIYFCDDAEHESAASNELLSRYGSASNWLDFELPQKVASRLRGGRELT